MIANGELVVELTGGAACSTPEEERQGLKDIDFLTFLKAVISAMTLII